VPKRFPIDTAWDSQETCSVSSEVQQTQTSGAVPYTTVKLLWTFLGDPA